MTIRNRRLVIADGNARSHTQNRRVSPRDVQLLGDVGESAEIMAEWCKSLDDCWRALEYLGSGSRGNIALNVEMRNGHEKSKRRDKTKKPHYWEKWLDEGLQVCSFRGGKVNPVIGEILVSLKDTTRALRFVSEWTIHEFLDDKLIHICRSHSGRYKTKFEESLRCNSKSSRLVIKRTPECEFDEIAYWVDSSHHALAWGCPLIR